MTASQLQPVIVSRELRHHYGEGELRSEILHGLNFEVYAGEVTLLVGPSGSGKSTLLTLVGALRSVEEGSLQVLGQELKGAGERQRVAIRRRIGFIFQSHNLVSFTHCSPERATASATERTQP